MNRDTPHNSLTNTLDATRPPLRLNPAVVIGLSDFGGATLHLLAERLRPTHPALLEGLAGYGAFERDGYARVLDLAMYVGRMVPNRTGDKQHPIFKASAMEEDFPVALSLAASKRKAGPAAA